MARIERTEGVWPPGMAYLRVGAGTPLLYLPGLSGDSGTPAGLDLALQLRLLGGAWRGRELIWLNPRADLRIPATMPEIAAEHAQVIRQQLTSPIDVMGVSTGGTIALQLAADHPQLVRRLVVVSAAHRLGEHGRRVQQDIADALRSRQPRRAGAVGIGAMAAGPLGALALGAAGWLLGRRTFGGAGEDVLAILAAEDGFDLAPSLGRITAPTLVVGADRDRYYSPRLFRETVDGIHDGRLILYRGTGHFGTMLRRRFGRDVSRFLGAEPAAASR